MLTCSFWKLPHKFISLHTIIGHRRSSAFYSTSSIASISTPDSMWHIEIVQHKRPTILVPLQVHMSINAVQSKQFANKNREPHHLWVSVAESEICLFIEERAGSPSNQVSFSAIRRFQSSKGKKKKIKAVHASLDYSQASTHIGPELRIRGFEPDLFLLLQYTKYLGRLGLRTGPISAIFQRHIWKAQTYLVSWGHCSEDEEMYNPLSGCIWTPNCIPSN